MALADLPAAGTWTNWVGNQSFTPARFAAPASADEVAALVGEAAAQGMGVRVVGAGHSFTPVVQTSGLLLDLSAVSGVVSADPSRLRAVARAGTPIHGFYEPLWSRAWRCATRATSTTSTSPGRWPPRPTARGSATPASRASCAG